MAQKLKIVSFCRKCLYWSN